MDGVRASNEERGRHWYHFRPRPRRRTDFMGINSMWWMTLLWIVVIALAFWPFPLW